MQIRAYNPFKRIQIGYLFFGGFAGVIILLISVVTGVSYRLSVQETVGSTTYYQQSILNQLDKQLNIQMREIENISLAISRNSNVQTYLDELSADYYTRFTNAARMTFDLANISYSMPIVQSIHFYVDDPPPTDFQSPVKFMNLAELRIEPWFSTVEHSDFCWIGEHDVLTNQGNVSVISYARKIYNPNNEYVALLLLDIKASEIIKLMQGEDGETGSNRVLLDSGGRPVTFIGNLRASDYERIVSELGARPGIDIDRKGSTVHGGSLIVWSKLFSSDWLLMEVTPWSRISEGSLRTAAVLFSIGIGAVIAALVITLFLSKQFMKPIRMLLKGMNSFSLGAKDPPLPADYRNEFGVMFKGFRGLMDRTTELYDTLEAQYKRQKETEIQALQAMINPHFLYNTLDQLNWMAIEAGEDKMSRVLELMGRMFRIGLSNGRNMITIRNELLHLECYLQIQQIRQGDKLAFDIEVPDGILDLYIPKLTLQPFVENAVMHGFHLRESGSLAIRAHEQADSIVFTVSDNGVGIEADWESQPRRETGGYGIRNVRDRLIALFGPEYDIAIAAGAGGGTAVTIRVPKLLTDG